MNCLRLFKSNYTLFRNFRSVKYVSQLPSKFVDIQEKWKEKDGVAKNWNLIYKAPMENILNITAAYLTTTTAIISGSGIYFAAFLFDINKIYDPFLLGDSVIIANDSIEFSIYIVSFIVFHVAIKVLLSKFVIRLYQDGDKYLAIFRGNWYNSIVKHEFHLNEFKKLNPTLVVSWGDSRFSLGKKHGILLDNYFKTPEYFNYLLYKKKPQESEND